MKKMLSLLIVLPSILFAPNNEYKHFCHEYDYCDEIVGISMQYGIDPEITLAVLLHESGIPVGYHKLSNRKYIRGRDGEYGLMQVMPYNFPKSMEHWQRFNIVNNIEAGVKYLSMCKKRFDRYDYVLMCYNKGPNNPRRWDKKYLSAVMKKYYAIKQ